MKKIFALFLMGLAFLVWTASVSAEVRSREFSKAEIEKMEKTKAVVETRFGNIEIAFYPKEAPNHVDNFLQLARKGFYDGSTFHRVIPGFMIQGGDPKSKDDNPRNDGTGGPGYSVKAEFNKISHKRGILSMARSRNPDSGGSQFFICVADAPHLDGQYTVFGHVTSGLEAVDQIVRQPRNRMDNPLERVEIKVRVIEP